MVDDIAAAPGIWAARPGTVGSEPEILGPPPQQQVGRRQQDQDENPERPARGPPAAILDQRLQPRQQSDRADPDPGKGDAEGETAAADEPVGQIERLADISETVDAASNQSAKGQIELPRPMRERGQQQPGRHRDDA